MFVGAKPDLAKNHPGGQSTAALGLIEFCSANNILLDIIDSAQESFPMPSFSLRLKRMFRRQAQLISSLIRTKYDGAIIFCGEGFSFYEKCFMALVCRVFRIEAMLCVRSGHFITACESSYLSRRLSKLLLRIPRLIMAQSGTWEKYFLDLGVDRSKVIVIRNWLSPGRVVTTKIKRAQPAQSGSGVVFIFVGWLVREKGVLELMEAIRSSSVLRECSIIFAGDGNLLDHLMQIKIDERLSKVQLLGWQSPKEVDSLLEQAHVFVLPSYAEGFPNALLEALSHGLAAIVTPVGGIPDSARSDENSIWVKPMHVSGLRMAMEKLVSEPELIEKYSMRSLEIAREYHNRDRNCKKLFESFTISPCFK